jgi:hypothetical protein
MSGRNMQTRSCLIVLLSITLFAACGKEAKVAPASQVSTEVVLSPASASNHVVINSNDSGSNGLSLNKLNSIIVNIQKSEPSIDPNTRDGEKARAEWEENKAQQINKIEKNEISGICIYEGQILTVVDKLECVDENSEKRDNAYSNCAYKYEGYAVDSNCGPGPSRGGLILRLSSKTLENIKKIYNGDRIKFIGVDAQCDIYFTRWAAKKEMAAYSCKLDDVNAEIIK